MSNTSIKTARSLFNTKHYGILSTISAKLGGYPFGSVTPYCPDGEGMPVVLISTIAQHTKNIVADNRCSITIVAEGKEVQAEARLCVIGNMELVDPEEKLTINRYYAHFPETEEYDRVHKFHFYRLKPITYRYIGGFGDIHWFNPKEFLESNPFLGMEEERIVSHMNEDHAHNLAQYITHYKGIQLEAADKVRMASIDADGFDVFVNQRKVRFDFEQPITTAEEARQAMVALAKGASNAS